LLNDSTKDKLYTILFLRPKETFWLVNIKKLKFHYTN
jgi:hypothetical protein